MTGFVVPTPTPAASGWSLLDWKSLQLTGKADTTGVATVDCGQVPPGYMWLVDRLIVQASNGPGSTVRAYDGQAVSGAVLDVLGNGIMQSADYPNGLLIRESSSLVVQWTGAVSGSAVTVSAQVRVYQHT